MADGALLALLNPSYSYAQLPDSWSGEVPAHWKVMAESVHPPERGIPEFRDIEFSHVTVTVTGDLDYPQNRSRAFEVKAYPEKPMRDIRWSRVRMTVHEAGYIAHAQEWQTDDVVIRTLEPSLLRMENPANVELPVFESLEGSDGREGAE
ncbi:hypothetical protein [Paenibacillus aestuarii]|uniref:Uncharacterized protein n=1 Tax=Paenibacillus aestuarii TaxID=516965 RepID=A0ABW0K650_9BACL|nr:hypothetical protein [Paenibacillus aestuarii]